MGQTCGITVKVDSELHARATADRTQRDMTMSAYITMALEKFLNGKDDKAMADTKMLAVQISEALMERIDSHLKRNPGLTKKEFVAGVVEKALDVAEATLRQAESPADAADTPDIQEEQ